MDHAPRAPPLQDARGGINSFRRGVCFLHLPEHRAGNAAVEVAEAPGELVPQVILLPLNARRGEQAPGLLENPLRKLDQGLLSVVLAESVNFVRAEPSAHPLLHRGLRTRRERLQARQGQEEKIEIRSRRVDVAWQPPLTAEAAEEPRVVCDLWPTLPARAPKHEVGEVINNASTRWA